jgi:hypothetical protein
MQVGIVAVFLAQVEAKRLRNADMQMEREEIEKISLMRAPQKKKKNSAFCQKKMKRFQSIAHPKCNMS